MVALLPRGGVLSVGVLDLLAIDLVVRPRLPLGCVVGAGGQGEARGAMSGRRARGRPEAALKPLRAIIGPFYGC